MLIYSSKSYIGIELSFFESLFNDSTKLVTHHNLRDGIWYVDLRSRILPLSTLRAHGVAFSIYATEPLC